MAEELAYESWTDSETVIDGEQLGSTWDQVQLGEVILPGVCTIDDFEYGNDVDVQKRRKKEKAKLRDNGIAPCAFSIVVEINGAQWHEWLKVLPKIQPRREGAVRTPMNIVHPLVNAHGVKEIYVHKIKVAPPSARDGMKITIRVGEWFEEEKDAQPQKQVKYSPRPSPLIAGAGAGNRIANLGSSNDEMASRAFED